MKRNTAFAIISGMLLCGCQQIDITPSLQEPKTFYATIEDNDETKTTLGNNGDVLWKKNDQVSVFDQSSIKETYRVTDDSDGKTSAELVKYVSSIGSIGSYLSYRVAYYPSDNCNSINKDGIITCTLPATQNYAGNSFDEGAFPMVAVTTTEYSDRHFVFKNILGAVKLQLKGFNTVKSITISGNNNEILWGSATVTASNTDAPSIALSNASAKTVTLDCGAGVKLNKTTATSFTIALPPMVMTNGFTVTIYDTDGGKMEIKTNKSQTISRSGRLVMPEKLYNGAVDLGLSVCWATYNLGARAREQRGSYYQWGDISEVNYYDWPAYKWCNGTMNTLTKYNTISAYGTVDNKTVLEMEDDAARAALGEKWRIPTDAEWDELINTDNCSWTWTTINGVIGYKVQSKKAGYTDNWIFLPAAGHMSRSSRINEGTLGRYWSRSLYTPDPTNASDVYISEINFRRSNGDSRIYGFTIRPVIE